MLNPGECLSSRMISCLCAQSCAACEAWRDAGSPSEGPLSKENNRLQSAVRESDGVLQDQRDYG